MYAIHLFYATGIRRRFIVANYKADLEEAFRISYTFDYGWTKHEIDLLDAFGNGKVTGIRIYAYGHEHENPLLELYP